MQTCLGMKTCLGMLDIKMGSQVGYANQFRSFCDYSIVGSVSTQMCVVFISLVICIKVEMIARLKKYTIFIAAAKMCNGWRFHVLHKYYTGRALTLPWYSGSTC